jgi:hypothetical protein
MWKIRRRRSAKSITVGNRARVPQSSKSVFCRSIIREKKREGTRISGTAVKHWRIFQSPSQPRKHSGVITDTGTEVYSSTADVYGSRWCFLRMAYFHSIHGFLLRHGTTTESTSGAQLIEGYSVILVAL